MNQIRPRWDEIEKEITGIRPREEWDDAWTDAARQWLTQIKDSTKEVEYNISETQNFLLLCSSDKHFRDLLLRFLERALIQISSMLEGIATDEGFGKHVVIIFYSQNTYNCYLSDCFPDSDINVVDKGMYINQGYGHFVYPMQNLSFLEPGIVYDMSHMLISHLPLPLWLVEGIADNIVNDITKFASINIDDDFIERHENFWRQEGLQGFWSGEYFYLPGLFNSNCHELAQFFVREMSKNWSSFKAFVLDSDYKNCGQVALINNFGISLGEMATNLLGDGNWEPG